MAARKGGSIGWLLIGILIGALLVAGAYFYITGDRTEAPPPEAGLASEAPAVQEPKPVTRAPPAAAPTAAPVAPIPAGEPTDQERQIAEDAAATGMTGPAPPPVDEPSN